MDQTQGPSLLEYARFHGIATPSTTVNPLEYIDHVLENSPSSKNESQPVSKTHTTNPCESIEREIDSEKLYLSKNNARLLSTVIRDTRAERVEVNWDDWLPSLPRIEGLKVELPVLTTHHGSDLTAITSSVGFRRGNEALSLLQTCLTYSLPKSSKSFNTGHEVDEKTKTERLNCTRESFLLIQNARKCEDIRPAMDACLETHLQAFEQAFREPGPPLIPIDFDELYSPSPSPKLKMLPSPVSSNPIKRHESPFCLHKTGALVSIPLEFGEGGTRAPGSEDEQSSNAQPEEEMRSFQGYSMPIGHASFGFREMKNIENEEHLFHPPDSTWNLAQSVVSTRPEVELAPERGLSECRYSTSFPSTLQSDFSFTFQETANDGDIDVGHSIEVEQGTQELAEGEILETLKPLKTSHGGNLDSMVVDTNWCKSKPRAIKQPITANYSSHNATSVPDRLALVDELFRHQAQELLEDQTSDRQQKRKNVKYDHKLKKKQHGNGKKRASMRPPAESQGSDLSSPFTALGSLPAFMETRGIAPKQRVNAESPYVATKNQQPIDDRTERQKPMVAVPDQHAEPVIQREEVTIISNTPTSQHIPQYPKNNQEPPLLFLSTSLLKSHLRLTRTLENTKDPPPTLIYRDYDRHTTATNRTIIKHDLEHEADIIISPSTGIILTTSQATTQLYLPGHKLAHPHLDGIKGINSPLRERIMLLAPRYERLYVLISHSGGTAKKQPTVDKRTLESMTSLTAFCNSVSVHLTIIPLIIAPSTPETIAQWIFGLANKHSLRLPETSVPRSIGFMPINPNINKSRVDPAMVETEMQWELFLRRAGLNPFAAQVVLLVLRREEDKLRLGSTYDQGTVPALSRFVEMSTETRRRLFAELIGERVLKRVEAIMDNDWQCGWVLNFDAV